jgi:hypothetical protein
MRKSPNIITLESVMQVVNTLSTRLKDDRWVPARPVGYQGLRQRLRAAWMVFTGKADALKWPGQ